MKCKQGQRRVGTTMMGLFAIAALSVPLSACSRSTTRSVAAFCTTLAAQRSQFLANYDTTNDEPLQAMVTGLGSLGEIPVIFDRLDKVAPADIEPDVAAVRDAFKQQIGSLGAIASNPLGGLAGALTSSFVAAGPFQRVSDYTATNCSEPAQSP